MLDLDAGKLFIIGIVALLVIGPKELPRVLRQLGQWTAKMRRMASEFQGQFMDAMREADFESLKKEVNDIATTAKIETNFNPVADVERELKTSIDQKPPAPLAAPTEPLPGVSQTVATEPSTGPADSHFAAGEVVAVNADAQPYSTMRGGGTHSILAEQSAAPSAVAPALSKPNVFGASRADARAAEARRRTERARHAAAAMRRRAAEPPEVADPHPAPHAEV